MANGGTVEPGLAVVIAALGHLPLVLTRLQRIGLRIGAEALLPAVLDPLADIAVHGELLAAARDDATMIIDRDPELRTPRGEALRTLLYLFSCDDAVKLLSAG